MEPAREYGYRHLEAIQDARRRLDGATFRFRPEDLRLPLRIHDLRKRLGGSAPERKGLDEVAGLLSSGEVARATRRLDELERAAPAPPRRGR